MDGSKISERNPCLTFLQIERPYFFGRQLPTDNHLFSTRVAITSAEGEKHLQQTELKGTKVKDILKDFQKWLARAHFEVADRAKSEKLKICDDPGLDEASQPLLIELSVYKVTPFK